MTKESGCCIDEPRQTLPKNGQSVWGHMRLWIGTPRGLTVASLIAVVLGLTLNWSWLVAVGVAPIILSIAPCAVMCALGLCMSLGKGSETALTKPNKGSTEDVSLPPSTRIDSL